MKLHLPDEIIRPLNLSEEELLQELAISLYAAKRLSFGQARKLAGINWFRFRQILDERGVPAHYGPEDFEQDLETLSQLSKS